ncbi:MAG: hypothetical protein HY652_12895, partial [Acidobacteria bacterium]|nr:hypothetical protein [Acidobacteriota bacterium]
MKPLKSFFVFLLFSVYSGTALPQQPQPTPPPAEERIALNFDNADLVQVINFISDALGINYIIDPGVRGVVNINASRGVRKSDLFAVLETILKLNGATLVKMDDLYLIAPGTAALKQSINVVKEAPGGKPQPPAEGAPVPPAGLQDKPIEIHILPLEFVTAKDMGELLKSFVSEGISSPIITYD